MKKRWSKFRKILIFNILLVFLAIQHNPPFVPSLFVDIRKCMDKRVFMGFEQVIIQVTDDKKAAVKHDEDDEPPSSDEKIKQEVAESQMQNCNGQVFLEDF